jgi:SIR2-like domain
MTTDLQEHLAKFSTNPYLFIGSGLSRRFISLPTWEELLVSFFEDSKIDGDYEYHRSKSNGNLPQLASDLAKDFHEIWWKSSEFKEARNKFKSQARDKKDTPFKIQLAEIVKKKGIVNEQYQTEIDLLKTSVIDGIISTNWDDFLETIFDDFKVYIGQQELLFSEGISIGEIYKIHGCISNPQSLVVTGEDYLNFNARNAYLAAKLLTIFVEHPIIFIGYSLSDENIQQIIDSIVRCVDSKNLDKLKDRLIFVEWNKGGEFEMKDSSMKLPDSKVLPIKLITTDSFEPIFQTLSSLKRHIPVKVLRKIKNSVVEFVKSSKPTSKIHIQDIETIDDDTSIEYAIGVGVASQFISAQGYKAIDSTDIIEDILNDNKRYDAEKLLENTFPTIMKGNAYLPIYKYLKELDYLNNNGSLNTDGIKKTKGLFSLKPNTPSCFLPPEGYRKKQPEIRRNHKEIKSIIKTFDKEHAIVFIPLLEHKSIDLKVLKAFLRECFSVEKIRRHTNFKKLVCLYDYLESGLNGTV